MKRSQFGQFLNVLHMTENGHKHKMKHREQENEKETNILNERCYVYVCMCVCASTIQIDTMFVCSIWIELETPANISLILCV